jgi:3'-5' exoribonuclease
MEKTQFIADLRNGQDLRSVFLIASARRGQARNGPFWKLELKDATGSLEAKIWSPQSQAYPTLTPGDLAEVSGHLSMYRERLEATVDSLRPLTPEERATLDPALFRPASAIPAQTLLGELDALCCKTFRHAPWRKLAGHFLRDPEVRERLLEAPAAKSMHHAYAGGLLEHTLSVCRLCLLLADHYPALDRQTLLAGALFHDMGKLWELSTGINTDYTDEGRLLGHISIILEKLGSHLRRSGLEPHLILHLQHLILSHHGQTEFGSPRLPATAEAVALHYADNIDAKLNQIRHALASVEENSDGWSNYMPGLERYLFRSLPTPGQPDPRDAPERKTTKAVRQTEQGSLLFARE